MVFVIPKEATHANRQEEGPGEPHLDSEALAVLVKLDEASPLSAQLQALIKDIGLRDRELTALAEVSRATLSRWRKEGDGRRPEQLDDLRVIVVQLIRSGAFRPRSVAGWLRSRNLGLSWQRPLDVLKEGDFAAVLTAAESACGARIPVKRIPQVAEGNENTSFGATLDSIPETSDG